jgi:HlyD family secretion protein
MRYWSAAEAGVSARATYKVTRGDLDITVAQTGELQTTQSTRITPEIDGEGTIVFLVDEGSRVKKGDVLVKLDTTDMEQKETNQVIEVENSRVGLVQAEQNKKIQELSNETTLSKARTAVETARMDLEKYGTVALKGDGMLDEAAYASADAPKQGEAYQSFRDAELAIEKAKTQLDRATTDFADMDKLLEKGYVTKVDFDQKKLNVLEAERALESAQLAHYILRTYTHPKKITQVQSDLKRAGDELKEAELSTNSQMVQRDAEITQSQKVYENRQKTLEETRDQLSKMTITAPEDGLVIYGDDRSPEDKSSIQVGAKIWRGNTLITLPNISGMIAATKVLEQDVNKVKVGQPALITIMALPDQTYKGKITKISSVVAQGGRRWFMSSEVKSFDVQVGFDAESSLQNVRPGMSCDILIEVDRLKGVLYVPLNAVFKEEGKDVCYVLSGSKSTPVNVTVGQSSDVYCEITDGLQEGQEVLLYSVAASQAARTGKEEAKNGTGGSAAAAARGTGRRPQNGGPGAEKAASTESAVNAGEVNATGANKPETTGQDATTRTQRQDGGSTGGGQRPQGGGGGGGPRGGRGPRG